MNRFDQPLTLFARDVWQLWDEGFDTIEISDLTGRREGDVYNVMHRTRWHRDQQKRKTA